jgi:GTP cyclohydrolase I
MTMRGVKKPGVKTVTMATRGEFRDNIEKQRLFLETVRS